MACFVHGAAHVFEARRAEQSSIAPLLAAPETQPVNAATSLASSGLGLITHFERMTSTALGKHPGRTKRTQTIRRSALLGERDRQGLRQRARFAPR